MRPPLWDLARKPAHPRISGKIPSVIRQYPEPFPSPYPKKQQNTPQRKAGQPGQQGLYQMLWTEGTLERKVRFLLRKTVGIEGRQNRLNAVATSMHNIVRIPKSSDTTLTTAHLLQLAKIRRRTFTLLHPSNPGTHPNPFYFHEIELSKLWESHLIRVNTVRATTVHPPLT